MQTAPADRASGRSSRNRRDTGVSKPDVNASRDRATARGHDRIDHENEVPPVAAWDGCFCSKATGWRDYPYYASMPLATGQTFAGYTIIRPLGSGGMGEVYLAQRQRA